MGLSDQYPAYGGLGPEDLRLGLGLGITATVLILLRIYVRLRVNKLGTHALIWAIVAWALTVVTQCFGILSVLHGLGNHIDIIIATGAIRKFLLYTWITVFFFNLAIPVGKVAVAVFLIEMDAKTHPRIKWTLIGIAVFNVVVNIPQVLMVWFQCNPPMALFDPLRQSQCDHTFNVYYTYFVGAVAAVSDLALAIIPAYMLWPLKIDKKLKFALSLLMGSGIVAAVAAVIRSVAAKHILDEDSSYGVGTLFYWGEVEEWLVIITMSIPPCWPLFKPYLQRFLSTVSNSNSNSKSKQLPTRSQTSHAHGTVTPGAFLGSAMISRISSRRASRTSRQMNISAPTLVTHEWSGDELSRARLKRQVWDKEAQGWMELNELEKGPEPREEDDLDSKVTSPDIESYSPIDGPENRRSSHRLSNMGIGHAV